MRYRLLFFLTTIFCFPLLISAQGTEWRAGVLLGLESYEGDLVGSKLFNPSELGLGFGLFVEGQLKPTLALRASLLTGKVVGDDGNYNTPEWRQQRDFDFETGITELSAQLHWSILGNKRYDEDGNFKRQLSPFLFAGIGVAFTDPKANFSNNTIPSLSDKILLDINRTEGNTRFVVPVGAGLKLDINQKIQLGAEFGFRPTFSDYLDGISLSANPDKNDWYIFGGLTLGIQLGDKDRDNDGIVNEEDSCPDVFGVAALLGCPDRDEDGVADREDTCPDIKGLAQFSGCPDTDLDGITDAEDLCPQEAGSKTLQGCPDSDGDGISDAKDKCPNEAGIIEENGCPLVDRDGDSIADEFDECPDVAGIASLNGCPERIDTDGDGIEDNNDRCPNMAGVASNNGCPAERVADTDNDGVPDKEDRCPNIAGLVTLGGCPDANRVDTDGDGISNVEDNCPNIFGIASNNGCPEVSQKDQEILDYAMKAVRFETGSNRLKRESYGILDRIAEIMIRNAGSNLRISGYTDNTGDASTNQRLSERRAKTCYDYLTRRGVLASRMSYAGYGESNPIETNDTSSGRRQNRRVEFELVN